MRKSSSRRTAIAISLVSLTSIGLGTNNAVAVNPAVRSGLTAQGLTATDSVQGMKSVSARLAQSDASLLSRTDAANVGVVVKLDYDATASYAGGVGDLAATSPKVTGQNLTGKSSAEKRYEAYTKGLESTFTADLAANVPAAKVGRSLQRVFGGVAVQLPANEAKTLLSLKGVAAVMADDLRQPLTDSSNAFIGSPTIWNQVGGQANAGKGIIFGDIDTGVWPEHPSLADNGNLAAPPAKSDNSARSCDFGDNPLTPAVDVFTCNNKLIGGQAFLDTYHAISGPETYESARDSEGHGTHTTTTTAGDVLAHAVVLGVDRGPVSGIAPGAWVISYKALGAAGGYSSDLAAAVEQAIADGVTVINYSISGGSNPYADAVELAFLDAYNAGVFVSASAGNSGPGAGTTDHLSPWVTTVAASTQTRAFQSTITVTDGATNATFVGSSITSGVPNTPIVMAKNIPGYNQLCSGVPPAGSVTGKIVACRRGTIARVQKGYNLTQGGAVGMILYNVPLQDTETDNHWLPTVHLADGTSFLAFMAAHPTASASFTAGVKAIGQGDVMAAFSSRGPGGQFLKPDVTAPGVQILAGNTPTPDSITTGPAGQYFQAIAGTSMSAPHVSGAALLVKALHPNWTPGAIKSALMTTATTAVVKETLVTAADPFDMGAGRIDLNNAGKAGLVFDESAANLYFLGSNPVSAVQLNLPSVNLPTMPGAVKVTRRAKNVTGADIEFRASATSPAGSSITVSPSEGTIKAGQTGTFTITVTSNAPAGQYFGQIKITPKNGTELHLPVAFFNKQGPVGLSSSCAAASIPESTSTTCTVTATNNSFLPTDVTVSSKASASLSIVGASGATVTGVRSASGPTTNLVGKKDGIPIITADPTQAGGYLDLASFGIAPQALGDDMGLNFNVPGYTFAGKTYSRVGVSSNGIIVAGGTQSAADVTPTPQTLPDTARPNGVLAPYWTDLDGAGDPGLRIAVLSGGGQRWLVVQWNVHLFGVATATRSFQVWIGLNGVEDVTFLYPGDALAGSPYGLTVGAENESGSGGSQITGNPAAAYVINSTPGAPGGSVSYTLTVRGTDAKPGSLTSSMVASIVPGQTVVSTNVNVTKI